MYLYELSLPVTLNEYTPTIFSFFGRGEGAQASRLLLGAPNLILAPLENFEPLRHCIWLLHAVKDGWSAQREGLSGRLPRQSGPKVEFKLAVDTVKNDV